MTEDQYTAQDFLRLMELAERWGIVTKAEEHPEDPENTKFIFTDRYDAYMKEFVLRYEADLAGIRRKVREWRKIFDEHTTVAVGTMEFLGWNGFTEDFMHLVNILFAMFVYPSRLTNLEADELLKGRWES